MASDPAAATGPLAQRVVQELRAHGLRAVTAESCTGGLVAAAITDIAGASDVLDCGFVTYANEAKTRLLGVPPALLAEHGAVSGPCARAMAEGALQRADADLAVAVTGVAGPGPGGTKPEGRVHFACLRQGAPVRHLCREYGPRGRAAVREASVMQALQLLLESILEVDRGTTASPRTQAV